MTWLVARGRGAIGWPIFFDVSLFNAETRDTRYSLSPDSFDFWHRTRVIDDLPDARC